MARILELSRLRPLTAAVARPCGVGEWSYVLFDEMTSWWAR